MKKIGYVLSGGGARGFAHLGVLQFLQELGLRPHAIAGTSAGAIAGALYANGKNPREILDLLKGNSYFSWSNLAWSREGIFSMEPLRKLLTEQIPHNDFEALPIRLFVAATDIIRGTSVIFSEGQLWEAVIASASVPVVFPTVKLGDRQLVDGGVLNNFPLEPLTQCCEVIIGSHVNKWPDPSGAAAPVGTAKMIDRCFHLAISRDTAEKIRNCHLIIEPPLQDYDMYDVRQAERIFEIGYQAAQAHKTSLKLLLAG